ncbi:MAG: glycoside hydrolase N-terminal domain-containing protein, partial [Kiritimatiellaeota bacterium]|nr:glycoside hydrolase N-terminal domain-containing protein [Kiritimatiellota bacterium]
MVMKLSADKPGALNGAITLPGAHKETTAAGKNELTFSGALDNGLKYTTQLVALNEGGSVAAQAEKLEFAGCSSVTLLLAAATDYVADSAQKYRGDDPLKAVARVLKAAKKKSFDELKAEHIADYQSLFNRVALDVGVTPADRLALPINERKVLHAEKGGDPDLEEILFQYGRYLLISCSRPGGLPANLQGLWNDSNKPPWHSDYHANINIQMNYWPAEPANLSECHTTLFDLITSQLPAWRAATAVEKRFQTGDGKPHGWAVRTSHGIHGDQGWQWDVSANAWYCQHFWWHYVWTGDKDWLKRVAYPVLKETCEFWAARLKPLSDGRLIVPNGWSPEHGPHEDGVSYSQQIVWDLFNNYAAASAALGLDADYRAQITAMRDKLVGPKVGSWGQLLEWMEEKKDKLLDTPNDHHRHTSHLFAVYPGQQISVSKTPEFAAAAKKSLDARGTDAKSDVREWSFAWRSALYARLHDGEMAHQMVQKLLADRNTCLNLYGLHPPMCRVVHRFDQRSPRARRFHDGHRVEGRQGHRLPHLFRRAARGETPRQRRDEDCEGGENLIRYHNISKPWKKRKRIFPRLGKIGIKPVKCFYLIVLLLNPQIAFCIAPPPALPARLPNSPAEVAELLQHTDAAEAWGKELAAQRNTARNALAQAQNALRYGAFRKAGGVESADYKRLNAIVTELDAQMRAKRASMTGKDKDEQLALELESQRLRVKKDAAQAELDALVVQRCLAWPEGKAAAEQVRKLGSELAAIEKQQSDCASVLEGWRGVADGYRQRQIPDGFALTKVRQMELPPPADAAQRRAAFARRNEAAAVEELAHRLFRALDEKAPWLASSFALYKEKKFAAALEAFRAYFFDKLTHLEKYGVPGAALMHDQRPPLGTPVLKPEWVADAMRGIATQPNRAVSNTELLKFSLGEPGAVNWAYVPFTPQTAQKMPVWLQVMRQLHVLERESGDSSDGVRCWLMDAYQVTGEAKYLQRWAEYADDWALNMQRDLNALPVGDVAPAGYDPVAIRQDARQAPYCWNVRWYPTLIARQPAMFVTRLRALTLLHPEVARELPATTLARVLL